jgi:hypothetical protein
VTTPSQVGPYVVLGTLGRGGMGVVLRAKHPRLPQEVAVKLVRGDALADESALERFKAEVLALARIQHPNVVPVLDAGRAADGSPYYVMPLVPGRSLAEILAQDGPLAPERAATIVRKLALALETAHVEAAVVHRDVKPGNVLVEDGTDEPRLLDFGLAKRTLRASSSADGPRTETGALLGTPEFMAPEQAQGGPGLVDARTDVYGLGALLYALLTGRPPHESEGRALPQILAAVLMKEPVALEKLAPGIPTELAAICRQAMAKEKERRYVSAGELARDLERFLAHETVLARPPGAWVRVQRALARNSIAVLSLAVVLVVATAVSASFAIRANRLLREKDEAFAERDAASRPLEALGLIFQGAVASSRSVYLGSPEPAGRKVAERAVRDLVEALRLFDISAVDSRAESATRQAIYQLAVLRALDEAEHWGERELERSPRSLMLLAGLHEVRHLRRKSCVDVRRRILALGDPNDPGTSGIPLTVELEDALDASDLARARRLSDEIERTSNFPALYRLLAARLYFELSRNDASALSVADGQLVQYLNFYGTDPDALALRSLMMLDSGHEENIFPRAGEAPRWWEAALQMDPRAPLALAVKARVLELQLDAAGALAAARESLALAPSEPEARLAEARALLLLGRAPEALEASARILERRDETQALMVRGFALLALDRDDEARATLVRSCEPTLGEAARLNSWAHVGLEILALAKRDQAAFATADDWLTQHATETRFNAEPLYFLRTAQEFERRGNRREAANFLEKLTKLYDHWQVPVPEAVTEILAAYKGEKPR